jgi:hypothetical protein
MFPHSERVVNEKRGDEVGGGVGLGELLRSDRVEAGCRERVAFSLC